MNFMSDDAKAILLLCGRLDKDSDVQPLKPSEYNELVRYLVGASLRPADLLAPENVGPAVEASGLAPDRVSALLKRGVQLGFAVEKWNQSNIWVLCRSDEEYPARYRSHLKEKAPPILFGVGDRSLLQGGGLAIVGSRNVDGTGEAYTRDAAAWCAQSGEPVVSGGAKGVDQVAMKAALDAGGTVIGVLAENLLRKSVARDARKAIAEDRLLLISPYHPEARFTVGTAMARNKLIYAMADYGLVVSADHNKGGTWAGATEELKQKSARPVFVRLGGDIPKGNRKLLDFGGIGFPSITPERQLNEALSDALKNRPAKLEEQELLLYAESGSDDIPAARVQESSASSEPSEDSRNEDPPLTIYEAVLPVILAALEKPVKVDELCTRLDVAKGQLQAWLKQAQKEKKVKKLNKPARYVRA